MNGVQHGDWRCYKRYGCRQLECLAAWSQHTKVLKHRRSANPKPVYVNSIGTVRRLHALSYMGYSTEWMGEQLGCSKQAVSYLWSRSHGKVEPTTAAKVKALYDRHSMIPSAEPAAARVRRWARRRGYVGPLAWDDDRIDDPRAIPLGLLPEQRQGWCRKGLHILAEVGTYRRRNGRHECLACRQDRNEIRTARRRELAAA